MDTNLLPSNPIFPSNDCAPTLFPEKYVNKIVNSNNNTCTIILFSIKIQQTDNFIFSMVTNVLPSNTIP